MSEVLEYPGMNCEVRGSMSAGHLKITDEKVTFTHTKSGRKDTIKGSDMELVNWQRLAGVWGIRLFTKDGSLHRFAGFKEPEKDRLASHFTTHFSLDMLERELSVKGWNWGTANFSGSVLNFEVGKHDAFEIPLTYVQHCNAAKNEVTLEFSLNDDAPVNLSEMRFHIPPSASGLEGEDDPAEVFREQVVKKANIATTSTGDAIAIFREIHSLSPRGRYDIKMYPTFIHLHGKTFDYKIPTGTVMRLFLLPHKDQRQMFFCVNLDPPIKQGQTRYHYLVFSFMQDDETDLELPFSEEELKEKYEGKLEKEMKGPTFEVVSKLMKAMVNRKITVPGAFMGHSGTPAISCSYKAASGFIYPLERGFMFVYKPPIFVKFDDVQAVHFARSGGSNRSFDIEINTRGETVYTFSSIEKDEYSRLYEFLKSKKITVKSTGKMDASKLDLSENNIDHHAELVKANAQSSEGSDNSMSSDDTDFNPDKLEAKDAKEEYDSDPSDTGSDTGGEEGESGSDKERKKKEKAEKKAAKAERKKSSAPRSKPSGEKKKKKTKLPGQPKKPMTAFFMFMQEEGREAIKKESPEASVTEVGKKGGEKWRELDSATKEKYENKVKEAKERYEEEYKEWLENGGAEAIEKQKREKKDEKKESKKESGESPKSPKKKSKSAVSKEQLTGGSGKGFQSKEFIEDSDSGGGEKAGSGSGSGSGGDKSD